MLLKKFLDFADADGLYVFEDDEEKPSYFQRTVTNKIKWHQTPLYEKETKDIHQDDINILDKEVQYFQIIHRDYHFYIGVYVK